MRRTLTGIAVLLLALAVPGLAAASQPVTTSFDTSGSFIDDDLSAACGFEVTVTRAGLTQVTLFSNSAGLVVRETDSTVGTTITYSSATTGRSFTYPRVLVITFDYGSGAVLGSPVTVSVVGSQENLPGTRPFAGQVVFTGEVVGFADGIPEVEIDDQLVDHGSRPGEDVDVDAICAALS